MHLPALFLECEILPAIPNQNHQGLLLNDLHQLVLLLDQLSKLLEMLIPNLHDNESVCGKSYM
jgi:hypothetical protein